MNTSLTDTNNLWSTDQSYLDDKVKSVRTILILLYTREYDYELMELEREFNINLQDSYKYIFEAINKKNTHVQLKGILSNLIDMPESRTSQMYINVCMAIYDAIRTVLNNSRINVLVGTSYKVVDLLLNGIVLEKMD